MFKMELPSNFPSYISVVTPMMNEEFMLPNFMRFIETFASEWVVIDGGSTDKSLEMIKHFGKNHPNINLILRSSPEYNLEKCKNVPKLVNIGCSKSHGEWIFFGQPDEVIPNFTKWLWSLVSAADTAVWRFRRLTFSQLKPLKVWRDESEVGVIRLWRKFVRLNESVPVHWEATVFSGNYKEQYVSGPTIYHYCYCRPKRLSIEKFSRFSAAGALEDKGIWPTEEGYIIEEPAEIPLFAEEVK